MTFFVILFIYVYLCRPSITSEISVLPVPSNSLVERDHFATTKESPGCKLCVQMDPNDPSKPLQVTHVPHLNHKDAQLADQAIKVSKLILSKVVLKKKTCTKLIYILIHLIVFKFYQVTTTIIL